MQLVIPKKQSQDDLSFEDSSLDNILETSNIADNDFFQMVDNYELPNNALLEQRIKEIRSQFIKFASNVKQWDKTISEEINNLKHELKSLNKIIINDDSSYGENMNKTLDVIKSKSFNINGKLV